MNLGRIYNRAFSPSEIQDLYNETAGTGPTNNTSTNTPFSATNQVLNNPLLRYDFTEPVSQVFMNNLKNQSNITISGKNTINN